MHQDSRMHLTQYWLYNKVPNCHRWSNIYWKWLFSSFTLFSVKTKTPIYGNDKKDIMTEQSTTYLEQRLSHPSVALWIHYVLYGWHLDRGDGRWAGHDRCHDGRVTAWQAPDVTDDDGRLQDLPGTPASMNSRQVQDASWCKKPLLSHDAQISASPLEDLCTKLNKQMVCYRKYFHRNS